MASRFVEADVLSTLDQLEACDSLGDPYFELRASIAAAYGASPTLFVPSAPAAVSPSPAGAAPPLAAGRAHRRSVLVRKRPLEPQSTNVDVTRVTRPKPPQRALSAPTFVSGLVRRVSHLGRSTTDVVTANEARVPRMSFDVDRQRGTRSRSPRLGATALMASAPPSSMPRAAPMSASHRPMSAVVEPTESSLSFRKRPVSEQGLAHSGLSIMLQADAEDDDGLPRVPSHLSLARPLQSCGWPTPILGPTADVDADDEPDIHIALGDTPELVRSRLDEVSLSSSDGVPSSAFDDLSTRGSPLTSDLGRTVRPGAAAKAPVGGPVLLVA